MPSSSRINPTGSLRLRQSSPVRRIRPSHRARRTAQRLRQIELGAIPSTSRRKRARYDPSACRDPSRNNGPKPIAMRPIPSSRILFSICSMYPAPLSVRVRPSIKQCRHTSCKPCFLAISSMRTNASTARVLPHRSPSRANEAVPEASSSGRAALSSERIAGCDGLIEPRHVHEESPARAHVMCPTSLLPICPSGNPTEGPDVCISVCG